MQEQKLRAPNLILHNIPEGAISLNGDIVDDDTEKIKTLCKSANIKVDENDFVSVTRVGKSKAEKSRPLLLTLKRPEKSSNFVTRGGACQRSAHYQFVQRPYLY